LYILLVGTAEVFETMNAKNPQERQLKREIRWTREALSIAENCETHQTIQEAHQQQIPLEFRHLCEVMDPEELESHISRLESDLKNLQTGEWE